MARLKRYDENRAYRVYMSDSFYLYSEQKRMSQRFIEFLNPLPQDNRTGDEIAVDILAKLKGG